MITPSLLKCLMLTILCLTIVSAYADQLPQTPFSTSNIVKTDTLEQAAKRWALTVEEYRRYQDIMKGPLGRWNPQIDPLLALGMFADNPQKQQRYAEQFAQQEYELTVRTQTFEQVYRAAFKKLFPQATMVNSTLLKPFYDHQRQKKKTAEKLDAQQTSDFFNRHNRLQAGDRLVYFPNQSCNDCENLIHRIYHQLLIKHNTSLDIYIRGSTNDQMIRHWAAKHHLKPAWIESGTITLNPDNGLFDQILATTANKQAANTTVAILYLHRNNQLFAIDKQQLDL